MRQPLSPNYRSLSGELDDVDALTIQAFMQHGGLTESELSEVFGIAPHTSERRIARMLDLEIIEPEPCFAGFRVRPQAWRFVREVLHGRNLA
jgi:DNA-binding MarR family transcriptional regulator